MRGRGSRAAVAGAFLVLASIGAACGSDDDGDTAVATTQAGTTASPPETAGTTASPTETAATTAGPAETAGTTASPAETTEQSVEETSVDAEPEVVRIGSVEHLSGAFSLR